MPLANPDAFQFALKEPFYGRLFTRRPELTNDIRLLIGANILHAPLSRECQAEFTFCPEWPMVLLLCDLLQFMPRYESV